MFRRRPKEPAFTELATATLGEVVQAIAGLRADLGQLSDELTELQQSIPQGRLDRLEKRLGAAINFRMED